MWFGAYVGVCASNLADGEQIHCQPIRIPQRLNQGRKQWLHFHTSLFTSAGILHGLHSDEALPALRPGQQSLLLPAAAWRRALPPKPAVHLASSAQIPNEHAGEEPNGHGWHAVSSAAGTSANARAPARARVTCSMPRRSSCSCCGRVPTRQWILERPFIPVRRCVLIPHLGIGSRHTCSLLCARCGCRRDDV